MSGNKKTADLHSLKTRQMIMQYPDGSFPAKNTVLAFANDKGTILPTTSLDISSIVVQVLSANTAFINDLSANTAFINDLSANTAFINDLSANTAFINDLSANTISTDGDIVVNNANLYVYGDQNLTGSVQATYITLLDPSQNNVDTYLWANNQNLYWQNTTETTNISQAVNNMSIGDSIQQITGLSTLSDVKTALNQLLTLFGNRKIFVTYPGSPPSGWTQAVGYPSTLQPILTIAYSGTNFVIGSETGALSILRYSTDGGITWTNSTVNLVAIISLSISSVINTLGTSPKLLAVLKGPSQIYVAQSIDHGVIFTDTGNYFAQFFPSEPCTIYTNGLATPTIVVGGTDNTGQKTFTVSTNGGTTWSLITTPITLRGKTYAIASNGGSTFVAVGTSSNLTNTAHIAVSTNTGVSWTTSTTVFNYLTEFSNVIYSALNFIAILSISAYESSAIFTSTDGFNWTAATGIVGSSFINLRTIARGAANIVAGGQAIPSTMFYSSTNGTSWLPVGGKPFSDGNCQSIYYDSSGLKFYAVGTSNTGSNIWESADDGVTWTLSSNTAFGPGGFGLAITSSASNVVAVGLTSPGNGDIWHT